MSAFPPPKNIEGGMARRPSTGLMWTDNFHPAEPLIFLIQGPGWSEIGRFVCGLTKIRTCCCNNQQSTSTPTLTLPTYLSIRCTSNHVEYRVHHDGKNSHVHFEERYLFDTRCVERNFFLNTIVALHCIVLQSISNHSLQLTYLLTY